jgi:hypothetical protein
MNYLDQEATKIFSFLYQKQSVKIPLLLILGTYFIISPKLPNFVHIMYNNIIFKFLIISFIIFLSMHDKQLAIMFTLIYLYTVNKLKNTVIIKNKI